MMRFRPLPCPPHEPHVFEPYWLLDVRLSDSQIVNSARPVQFTELTGEQFEQMGEVMNEIRAQVGPALKFYFFVVADGAIVLASMNEWGDPSPEDLIANYRDEWGWAQLGNMPAANRFKH